MTPHLPTIHTFSEESIGYSSSLMVWLRDSTSSSTWASANLAFFIPFRVLSLVVVNRLFVMNGTTVSGNIDVGIYSVDGVRLVSSGSTAQAGTNSLQSFDVSDITLIPGLYYFGLALDNTTGTTFSIQLGQITSKFSGLLQQTSAFPLPATATFASPITTRWTVMGLTSRSFL